jgi:citrate synthase
MDSRIASRMGASTPSTITVRGHDLCTELIGRIDLGAMAWLELTGRLPTEAQSRLVNAVLVTLVEHGMTPMAMVARLTYLGAPESLQAAVAAGLCGMGTTFAGTTEGAARLLADAVRGAPADAQPADIAARLVPQLLEARKPIPGIGHPVHKPIDPRTPALFQVARETGYHGRYIALMEAIAAEAERRTGKSLPVNATGAIGAIACELGLDWRICRGLSVIARAVGLVGHLNEETQQPIARALWEHAEATVAANLAAGDGADA